MRLCFLIFLMISTASCFAQSLSNGSLNGKYFLRHVQFTTDSNNNVTDARSIIGTITFNGSGNYSVTGQQVIGTAAVAAFNVSGNYSVSSGGNVALTNPQTSALSVNARFGAEGLIGASTEAAGNTFDMFVAIPAPTATQNNAGLSGTWQAADLELTAGSTAHVRDSIAAMVFDGAGNITSLTLRGHAADFNGGLSVNQTINGGIYSVSGDGTGTTLLPAPAGLSGTAVMMSTTSRTLLVSQTGHVILAGTPGAHDLFVAVKMPSGTPALAGRYWNTGLRVDSTGSSDDYAGSSTVISASSNLLSTRRLHVSTNPTPINVTSAALFTLASDGTGSAGSSKIAVGSGTFIGANVGSIEDPSGFEIAFGETIPTVSGTGVFVNPQAVVNAAGNAPAGDAISPGEFIAIYGSGFAGATTVATPPYPASLGGVTVTIGGLPAPIYFVGSGQIDCLVPYKLDLSKGTTTISVNNNGAPSNQVTVLVAKTSPGIFSNDTSGTGDGAFLHVSTGLQVTPANPAKKGEILSIYLTGLGALQNPVADGTAPNPPAADFAISQVQVYVNGIAVTGTQLQYAGLNPVYPGLYQINFTVPANLTVSGELPVAIQTPEAFTDQINLSVQ